VFGRFWAGEDHSSSYTALPPPRGALFTNDGLSIRWAKARGMYSPAMVGCFELELFQFARRVVVTDWPLPILMQEVGIEVEHGAATSYSLEVIL
jgi:hypothetical protein